MKEEEMSKLIDNIDSLFRNEGYNISRDKIANFVEVMCFVLDYVKEGEKKNEKRKKR